MKICLKRAIEDNHKKYVARLRLFKQYGYDMVKERGFIIEKALPLHNDILEVGTGKGHFSMELAKKGYRLTSIDVSREDQKIAKLNLDYFELGSKVKLKISNAEKLCFKDGSFKTVFLVNTLHHLKNPFKVLSELIRVTTFDGKLIISDFTKHGFAVLDKIHASEGAVHEVGKIGLNDIGCCLLSKGFRIEKSKSQFQDVIVTKISDTIDLFA